MLWKLIVIFLYFSWSAETAHAEVPAEKNKAIQAARALWIETTSSVDYLRFEDDVQGGRTAFSARSLLGETAVYAAGVDAQFGVVDGSLFYSATAMPVGIGLRFGSTGALWLSAGLGVHGDGGGSFLRTPVELRGRGQVGSFRLLGWTAARLAPLDGSRETELELAGAVGWGRQRTYWRGSSAGSGPYLAVAFRDVGGSRSIVVGLGLELLGAN